MKGSELFKQYQAGYRPIVTFKDIEKYDLESFDNGMMATLISMRIYDNDSIICTFDFSEFEEYNKAFEVPAWESENGKVVWSESENYPDDHQVEIWIGHDEIVVFDIQNPNPVYDAFKASGSSSTYIGWLEEQYKLAYSLK